MGSAAESGALKLSYSRSSSGLSDRMRAEWEGAEDRKVGPLYDSDMRRFALKALVAILVMAAIAVAAAYLLARRSLPQLDGAATVAGISGPVEIVRDADAIPHVLASSKLDALFGLGYVHAQDRLWQMEFQRRI